MSVPQEFLAEGKSIKEYASIAVIDREQELGAYKYKSGEVDVQVKAQEMMMVADEERYEGTWNPKTKLPHGDGIRVWADGSMYVGEVRNGVAQGKGRLIHADNDVYEGDWKKDEASGTGIYYHADGAKYEGQWKNDKQSGQGVEQWPDGSYYDGEYYRGKKHGQGTFHWGTGKSKIP